MPTLLACLSTGKGTWTEVNQLLSAQQWTKVFLITNEFGKQNYTVRGEQVELIVLQDALSVDVSALVQQLKKELQGKISDFEIALNLASGSGKEHMAMLEAVMELGLNFRLVTMKNNQLHVLGMEK
ncbi:hypothetical protein HYX13_05815 [Candidatus Woesearchaeota archaeon]|nr:hypothetical protein [Candidatus Woesearchaeota archaeon]